MTDVTPFFNGLLKKNEAASAKGSYRMDIIDDFLKEAYKINSNIAKLHVHLKSIRQSYLSTAQPRKTLIRSGQRSRESQPLSDREREEIDASAKQMLRELNASIRTLADAEQLRRETETTLIRKKFVRGLGALGAWAAGSGSTSKSPEHTQAESQANTISTHRESVLWLLRQRLQECVKTQQDMMEIRLTREMEKNRSVLAKARGQEASSLSGLHDVDVPKQIGKKTRQGLPPDYENTYNPANDLTEEQRQMFERDNQDMLKHYENTLDQVRTAEKSLIEISELQTQLVNNLATQSAHIDQLVGDSMHTTENVGGGNKQLKKATKRPSTAKYTFYAACAWCTFLIVWDLLI